MPPPPFRPRSPYAVLGLAPDADEAVIRAAYRALMRKHHPDVSTAPDSAERARAITAAYRLIGTAEARAHYDRQQAAAVAQRAPVARPPVRPAPPPRRRRRWPLVTLILLCAAAAAVYLLWPSETEIFAPSYVDDGGGAAAVPFPGPPPLDPAVASAGARRAVALIQAGDIARARKVSADCPRASGERDWRAADWCAAFDIAAATLDLARAPHGLSDPRLATAGDLVESRYPVAGVEVDNRIEAIRAIATPFVTAARPRGAER